MVPHIAFLHQPWEFYSWLRGRSRGPYRVDPTPESVPLRAPLHEGLPPNPNISYHRRASPREIQKIPASVSS